MRPTRHTAKLLREKSTDIDARVEQITARDQRRKSAIATGDILALKTLKAGSTNVPQADMLLALLNNVLPSMINSQQAKIIGQCRVIRPVGTSKAKVESVNATIIVFYGVVPTSNNLLALVSATPAESRTE